MSVNIYDKANDKLNLVAGGTVYADAPVGSIQAYGGTTVPSGWLLCQGQAVSRTTYAELFAIIGTAYGIGDGSTTFNIPDLRETVPVGVGENDTQTIASHDVYTLGQFKDDQVQASNRVTFVPSVYNWAVSAGGTSAFGGGNASLRIGNTTHGKQLGVNYIIKAKHTSIPADFSDSLVGYVGQETNYNLYPWSHESTVESAEDNQNITIERDGWYSIDYTLTSNVDAMHTFTLRDFDSLGEVHTIMRAHYDKRGTFRQTFLVPLKAGTYRYSHSGIGTLNVYMNRRDFA